MTSINTNVAATVALRTLQSTVQQLDATQNRISTGLKIGEAKDNAAYWSIATTLKSDNKSLSTVKDALGLGAATVDTAYQGLNKAKEVLDEIKSKLTAATQDGVDRSKIQSEVAELQKQLKSIADSSTFSGENWLSVDSSAPTYNASKSVVSSFSRDSAGSVTIGTIGVDITSVALFDGSATGTGIVDAAGKLKKADGTALLVGGTDTATPAPSMQGLDAAVSVAGTVAGGAQAAVATLGTVNVAGIDANDLLTFKISVDGGAAKEVRVDLSGVTDQATLVTALNTPTTGAFAKAGVSGVTASEVGGKLVLTSASNGANSSVVVTDMAAFNGNMKTAAVTAGAMFGLSNAASPELGTGTKASATGTASAYLNGGTTTAGDKLKFTFEYNGDLYDAQITYTVGNEGATDTAFKALLDGAITNAVKRFTGTPPATPVTLGAGKITTAVAAGASGIVLTTVGAGADQKVSIASVTALAANGSAAATPANVTKGLSVTTTNTVGTGTPAKYALGTVAADADGAGDTLSFNVTLGSARTGTNVLTTKNVSFSTGDGGTTPAQMQLNAQKAFDAAFGANVVTVKLAGSALSLETVATGPNESIVVNSLSTTDGDGQTSSTLSLSAATAKGSDVTTLAGGTATAQTAFASQTFGTEDKVKFDVSVNGAAAKTVTLDRAAIEASLTAADNYVAGSGKLDTAAQYLKVVQKALDTAGVTGVSASIVASGADAGKLRLTTTATGLGQSVTVTNAATEGASNADTMSIDKIDVTDAALTALGVTSADRKDVLTAYITVVNEAINKVTTAAANLGSVAKRIDLQKSFVDTLMDTIDKGVGNLVDADISEESTRLQALQVKQQLGVQALSIANQSSQNILRLFQ